MDVRLRGHDGMRLLVGSVLAVALFAKRDCTDGAMNALADRVPPIVRTVKPPRTPS